MYIDIIIESSSKKKKKRKRKLDVKKKSPKDSNKSLKEKPESCVNLQLKKKIFKISFELNPIGWSHQHQEL